jgi:hypothetical protein
MNPSDTTLYRDYNNQMQKINAFKQVDELNFEEDEDEEEK